MAFPQRKFAKIASVRIIERKTAPATIAGLQPQGVAGAREPILPSNAPD
jgi:hypothetical protein